MHANVALQQAVSGAMHSVGAFPFVDGWFHAS
jgi:hypothetical protein